MFVRYIGGSESDEVHTGMVLLKRGTVFEVKEEKEQNSKFCYILKGVEGCFDKDSFEEVPCYRSFGMKKPQSGKPMDICIYDPKIGRGAIKHHITEPVLAAKKIDSRIHMVLTSNALYIHEVL